MSQTLKPLTGGAASVTMSAPNLEADSRDRLGLAEPRDYISLMKPRVMSLVVFTAWAGLVCAPGSLPFFQSLAAIFCIAVGAGAAGALNMWYDADIDARMTRTKKRPVPRGRITPNGALTFGVIMSLGSVWALYHTTNIVAAGLLAFTIFFYVVIYTMWLKRRTPQNIVIGGTPGALPPVIGWAAVTGDVSLSAVALFLIIFMWTPPHFWALALYKRGDYEKVGIPMMPNVKGARSTRAQILVYAIGLAVTCALPVLTGVGGALYVVVAGVLNVAFVALAFKVFRSRAGEGDEVSDEASLYEVRSGDKAARNLFAFSILYLFVIFGVLAGENLLGGLAI